MNYSQLLSGMEWVWLCWGISLLGLVAIVVRVLGRIRTVQYRTMLNEDGGVYTLSFLMAFPFIMMFLLIFIDTTYLLVGKLGTIRAANAGARSMAVWSSARPESVRQERVDQAVFTAMAPFVLGNPSLTQSQLGGPPSGTQTQAEEYALAYQLYSQPTAANPIGGQLQRPYVKQNVDTIYSQQRYSVAATRTRYESIIDRTRPDEPVRFRVIYRAPLMFAFTAKIFQSGSTSGGYEIDAYATMMPEFPMSDDEGLGIDYLSR